MTKLELKTTSKVIGGEPSGRRCDRLMRRGTNGSASAGDTWYRICEGKGKDGGNIGSY